MSADDERMDVKKGNSSLNDVDYDRHREEAMKNYLNDVGPISRYINESLEKIAKDKEEDKSHSK